MFCKVYIDVLYKHIEKVVANTIPVIELWEIRRISWDQKLHLIRKKGTGLDEVDRSTWLILQYSK